MAGFAKANGTGPFSVVSHETGTRTVLVRNDDYWDGAPSLDGVEIVTIPNQQAALLALRSGDLDMVTELGFVDVAPFLRDSNFNAGQARSGVAHDITLNARREALQNPAVRGSICDRPRTHHGCRSASSARLGACPSGRSPSPSRKRRTIAAWISDARRVLNPLVAAAWVNILTSTELRTGTTISKSCRPTAKIGINLTIDNVDAVTYRRRYVNEQDFDLPPPSAEPRRTRPRWRRRWCSPKGNVSGFEDPAHADAVLRAAPPRSRRAACGLCRSVAVPARQRLCADAGRVRGSM